MMSINEYIKEDDFIIIIRPVKQDVSEEDSEDSVEWGGEVQVSIVANEKESSLTVEEFGNMIMLCNFAAAAIPATEENVLIRELIQSYVEKHMLLPISGKIKELNILTLESDTEGNA